MYFAHANNFLSEAVQQQRVCFAVEVCYKLNPEVVLLVWQRLEFLSRLITSLISPSIIRSSIAHASSVSLLLAT